MPAKQIDLAALTQELQRLTEPLPLALPPAELTRTARMLALYLALLCQWNKAMNLVGPQRWQDILHSLVADSFYLAAFMSRLPLPAAPLCWDLGAGAGLPGIPLRMLWDKGDYYLVEVREKRALFLSTVLARLQWTHSHVFRGRVEDFFGTQARKADGIISRAFMPWPALLQLTRPHLAPQGLLLILALTPPPADLPQDWQTVDSLSYTVRAREQKTSTRYLWALQAQSSGLSGRSDRAGESPCPC